jgi:spore coat protein U-like protein
MKIMSIGKNPAGYAAILLLSWGGISVWPIEKSWAGNATSPLSVTAVVPPTASVDPVPINNVTYDIPLGTTVSSEITVTASQGSTLVITIGEGLNPASGSTPATPVRRMKSSMGEYYLDYELTKDTNGNQTFGGTSQTGLTVNGTGSEQTIPFYLRILPNQNVPVGNYIDTVTVTTDY